MKTQDQIDALLDLVDDTRSEQPDRSRGLVVLGLAERKGKRIWPSQAGWNLLGDLGRPFDI